RRPARRARRRAHGAGHSERRGAQRFRKPRRAGDRRLTPMHLNASVGLHFNGDCEAAFKFYERLLGLKLEMSLPWGASPLADQAPAGWGDKVLFARLRGPSMTLLGADMLPGAYRAPVGFNLT